MDPEGHQAGQAAGAAVSLVVQLPLAPYSLSAAALAVDTQDWAGLVDQLAAAARARGQDLRQQPKVTAATITIPRSATAAARAAAAQVLLVCLGLVMSAAKAVTELAHLLPESRYSVRVAAVGVRDSISHIATQVAPLLVVAVVVVVIRPCQEQEPLTQAAVVVAVSTPTEGKQQALGLKLLAV